MEKIINFCIISHIDHGKSTLADRFLEITKTLPKEKLKAQYLDAMDLEREKGITIKMHPVRMQYKGDTLNLIDTPGHIDFQYETSRALACVEGAVLLVDAVKGIQAQTLFNLENAQKQGLKIIGAVNKIDIAEKEQIESAQKELAHLLKKEPKEILLISAKKGIGIEHLLVKIIQEIPSTSSLRGISDAKNPVKALVFDSKYDSFFGVIAYLRVFEGQIQKGEPLFLVQAAEKTEVKEVGFFAPHLTSCPMLSAGQIGYIKTGIKEPAKLKVGETIVGGLLQRIPERGQTPLQALPGYQEPQPVLFLGLYPQDSARFTLLKSALFKLKLNDPAFIFEEESKTALGRGFRAGFLGALHAEIVIRRLKQEFGLDLAISTPQVVFKILSDRGERLIHSANEWPENEKITSVYQPFVKLEIITPQGYFNALYRLFNNFGISLIETKSLGLKKLSISAEAPLAKIISGAFYEALKNVSAGYGSFAFKRAGWRPAHLAKVDILIAGQREDAFSQILEKNEAFKKSKKLLEKLKEILPPQQFNVALQAVIGGKIIARETIKARRKDVTAPLYGGDVTRKRKLLDIQKKGKKELKAKARINIPAEVYLKALSAD